LSAKAVFVGHARLCFAHVNTLDGKPPPALNALVETFDALVVFPRKLPDAIDTRPAVPVLSTASP
jgi:hypothetical protein